MLKKKNGQAGAKPTANQKKNGIDLDRLGKFLGRCMFLIGQVVVEVISAFMLTYSFAIWMVPVMIILIADTVGVTYQSNGVDFIILVGAPGLMVVLLCTVIICVLVRAEHRLLSRIRRAAIAKQNEIKAS